MRMHRSKQAYRFHAIRVIVARVSQSKLWGVGIFLTLTASFTISTILLLNLVRYTQANILIIEQQPLTTPIMVTVILVSLYLSLVISLNVSQEYQNSTLEMLMVGPVDEIAYMLGNFLAQIQVFLYTLITTLVWSNLIVWLLNLSFRLDVFAMFLAAVLMAGELIAFGLLVAAWGGKTRNTLVYFLLVILLIGGLQIADIVVATLVQVRESTISDPLVVVRNALSWVSQLIGWISPYSQLNQSFEAILSRSFGRFFFILVLMAMQMSLMLAGSIALLKKKGVRG